MSRSKPEACNEALEKLPRYVDGELDPDQALRVAQHLEGCSGCVDAHRRAEETASWVIENLVRAEPPRVLPLRIIAALPFARRTPWGSAAAAILLFSIALAWIATREPAANDREPAARAPQEAPTEPAPETPVAETERPMTIQAGDLNGDGSFDLADLGLLAAYLVEEDVDPRCPAAADFDQDGALTPIDSVYACELFALNQLPFRMDYEPGGALPCKVFCP